MTFEFFTTHQHSTNLHDLSSKIGVNSNAVVKKNALEPYKAAKSAATNAEDKKQFADFMDSLKKKQSTNQNKSAAQKADENAKEESPVLRAGFQTQRSTTDYSNLTGGNHPPSLAVLSEKLQALIDETIKPDDTSSTGLIQTLDNGEGNEETESLRALLGALITAILGEDTESQEGTAQPVNDSTDTDHILTLLSGFTPQEITDLKAQINAYLTGKLSEEDETALIALINQFYPLTQPQSDQKAEQSSGAKAATISDNVLKTDLQANANSGQQEHHTQNRYDARYDARYEGSQPARDGGSDKTFETALKAADVKSNTSPTPQNASGQRFLQTNVAPLSSTLGGLDTALSQNGLSITPATPTAMQSALTNITTQAQSAAHNHPATQLVSMTMQKAVKAGDDTNIKLRLDPPDLGRVEVKMSVDKDSAAKIVLTAEKPETFLMLQRDSDALHRALADAGLDNGGDLSFELASEEHDFNQRNEGGSGKSATGGESSDEDEQITQSTMDWYVDPTTGRMHYNVLV